MKFNERMLGILKRKIRRRARYNQLYGKLTYAEIMYLNDVLCVDFVTDSLVINYAKNKLKEGINHSAFVVFLPVPELEPKELLLLRR